MDPHELHDRAEGEASYVPNSQQGHIHIEVDEPEVQQQPIDDVGRILRAVAQLVEQARGGEPGGDRDKLHERFMKLNPPAFGGTTDPLVAEGWIRKMETIFKVMEVQDEQKVLLATFRLEDNAKLWWDATERLLTTVGGVVPIRPPQIAWERFVKVFFEKYFPRLYRKEKEEEFITLKQGNRTVAEYEALFISLSRFAPDLVRTEESKCDRFQTGLSVEIKSMVSNMKITDYVDLVDRAMVSEKSIKEMQAEHSKKARYDGIRSHGWETGTSTQSVARGVFKGHEFKNNRSARGRFQARGGRTGMSRSENVSMIGPRVIFCYRCGGQGHMSRECTITEATPLCFHCHQPGHMRKNCPLMGATTSVGSVTVGGRNSTPNVHRGGRGSMSQSQCQGRVFALTQQDAQAMPNVVTGGEAANTTIPRK